MAHILEQIPYISALSPSAIHELTTELQPQIPTYNVYYNRRFPFMKWDTLIHTPNSDILHKMNLLVLATRELLFVPSYFLFLPLSLNDTIHLNNDVINSASIETVKKLQIVMQELDDFLKQNPMNNNPAFCELVLRLLINSIFYDTNDKIQQRREYYTNPCDHIDNTVLMNYLNNLNK